MRKIIKNNCIHELGLHLVFCTKNKKQIFTGIIEIELKEILAQVCTEYGWKIEILEINPSCIHLFIQVDPDNSPSEIIKILKNISAVHLFSKFPKLKGRKFWGSGLWEQGGYCGSEGSVSKNIIKEYIEDKLNNG